MLKPEQMGDAAAAAFSRLGAAALRRREGATLLGFHRFAPPGSPGGGLALPIDRFAEQMRHLRDHHPVAPLRAVVADLDAGRTPPPGTVCVTIDDGYASVGLAAAVLADLGLPWTLFVVTDFLDGEGPLWWDRVEDPESLKGLPDAARRAAVEEQRSTPGPAPGPISWEELRALHATGAVEIGSHTASHPILSRCDDATLCDELTRAHRRIEAELGVAPTLFAAPNGLDEDVDGRLAPKLKELGYTAAVSTEPGRVEADADPLWLPRTVVDGGLSHERFRLHAAGLAGLRARWSG